MRVVQSVPLQYPPVRARLRLCVPRRLVPVLLRVCEVERGRRDVQVACPYDGLACVERPDVAREMEVPFVLRVERLYSK